MKKKTIVIKMRSMKKLFGDDLLQLALLLSLMKLHDSWMHDMRSPRLHPKSMETLLERHQAEILEDLNSLGRYSRLSQYGGIPVHISAYIVGTEHGASCQEQNDGAESDSGISDTNHDSDQETTDHEDVEKEKNPEDDGDVDMDMECETILENFGNPVDVLGLQSIVGLTPPPEDQNNEDILGIGTGQDALEAELVHIDEQLMNIEEDLGHIDEAFYMMDQELAETISDDVLYENDIFNNNLESVVSGAAPDINLDSLGVNENNPFDDWQRESIANIDDLVLENVGNVDLQNVPTSSNYDFEEVITESENVDKEDEILEDPDLFPTDQAITGSAILEDFDDDLFSGAQSKFSVRSEIDRLVKNDVVLPQMPIKSNATLPYKPVLPLPEEHFEPEETRPIFNITEESRESSVDKDLLEEIDVTDVNVDQNDEDIIMQVLRECDIDFEKIQIDNEELLKAEVVKEEDIKEEIIDVEEVGFELNLVDGASAKVEIDFERLHSDLKSSFQESEDGSSVAEFTLSCGGNSGFNQRAFEHDHNYGCSAKVEPPEILLEPTTSLSSRRRNASESSGYSSMTEEVSGSRCRDEKMARKMNLPFNIHDIINSPVDTFSEMLGRPGLTSEQSQLCRDIRRRGKNKVAAQNCRKRKMDTIEELQSQVDQVRRRKEQLLRAREQLESERAKWSSKLSFLEQTVLAGVGKDLGMFTLEVTDSAVVVTSRLNAQQLLAAVGGAEKSPRGGRSRD